MPQESLLHSLMDVLQDDARALADLGLTFKRLGSPKQGHESRKLRVLEVTLPEPGI